jgi:SAM-dependent methyltransferase
MSRGWLGRGVLAAGRGPSRTDPGTDAAISSPPPPRPCAAFDAKISLVQRWSTTLKTLDRPGEKVLEIGPGPGRLLIPAAKRVMPGGEVVDIDIQPKMIERLKKNAEKAGVTNCSEPVLVASWSMVYF